MKSIQPAKQITSFVINRFQSTRRLLKGISLIAIPCLLISSSTEAQADEQANEGEKLTFVDHVLPIFRSRCGSCHNANDARGGLTVDNYVALMSGGSSGEVIEPGDSENSYLYSLITHASEPRMPPAADKLPENELETIAKWINQGAPEKSGSKVTIKKRKTIAKAESANERPSEVAMPENYYGDPLLVPKRTDAVKALAVSPWASIGAASGFKQVSLFDTKTLDTLGVLQFPEGNPRIIKFSRDGSLLLVGGGRGGLNGRVVVYDVKTGERRIEVGDEYDEVLAADISSDLSRIALGGPKKMLRVYDTETGEMISESKKHTDWITAIEFSPDSVLLASGDRSNGLIIWEAPTGNLFYDLQGHKGAITDISWRSDSNVVASSSEDRSIKLWEMQNGTLVKSWDAHGAGVSSIEYTRDGNIVSASRDQIPRLWNGEGAKIRDFPATATPGMSIAFDAETHRVIVGEWSGKISFFNSDDAQLVGAIDRNPATIPTELELLHGQMEPLQATLATQQTHAAQLAAQLEERQLIANRATELANQKQAELAAHQQLKTELDTKLQAAALVKDQHEAAFNQLKTAQTETAAALQQAEEAIRETQIALNKTGETATQAAAQEQKASTDYIMAKALAEELVKAAMSSEAEQTAAATDESIQKLLEERQTAAAAAQARATELEAGLAKAKEAALQARQAADTNAKLLVAVTEKEKAMKIAHQQAVQAATDAEKNYNSTLADFNAMQAAIATATVQDAELQAALAATKATADEAIAKAAATEDETKAIAEANAAAAASQAKLDSIQASIERLQNYQSQQATASVDI